MRYPIFIQCIIQAYPTGYLCRLSKGYPCAYPVYQMGYPLFIQCISKWLSMPIQHNFRLDIQLDIQLDRISISNWISYLICSPGLRAGSCIANPNCILAPGPASSAASDGLTPCSERKNERGASVTRVHIPLPHALRHPAGCRSHCCAAATNAAHQAAASIRCAMHGFVTLLIHEWLYVQGWIA
jgi:hypothetical protein